MAKKDVLRVTPISATPIQFTIRGTSPLITHAWSEKALRMMRMTAAERKKQPKVAREPEREALDSAYYMADNETFAIPLTGVKASIVGAAHKDLGIPRVTVQKALFVPQADSSGNIALELEGDPVIREDIVRVGTNQTDLRYRCEFFPWRARVSMEIDTEVLSVQDVIALVNRAGFSIGICEWRPEKGGEFGRFTVDDSESVVTGKFDREAA